MRRYLFLLFCLFSLDASSQEDPLPDFTAVDSLYREDQFYVGLTYNILQRRPKSVRQNKFSMGMSVGFLRDMPLNKKRNVAVAAGLGYALNMFNHNLQIARIGDADPTYGIIGDVAYDKNKMIMHYVELPVEFRWRTSAPQGHVFWRVYTGFKASYLFYDTYKFKGSGGKYSITGNDDLNQFQYSVYIAGGRNTWTFQLSYGLTPLFKSAELDGQSIDMQTLNFGFLFYIL